MSKCNFDKFQAFDFQAVVLSHCFEKLILNNFLYTLPLPQQLTFLIVIENFVLCESAIILNMQDKNMKPGLPDAIPNYFLLLF